MQQRSAAPMPCPLSPLSCSITAAVPCMLVHPQLETSNQHCWWQQRQVGRAVTSDEHCTVPAVSAEAMREAPAGREGDPADDEAASEATAAQSAFVSVGAWVRMPPSMHLQGWDLRTQGSQKQFPAAFGTTENGVPVLHVLACSSAGYVPTQMGSVTELMSSSDGAARPSCGSGTGEPHLEEQLSSTRLHGSTADGTELFKVTLQLPREELAPHVERPRLLHLELWQGRLLLSSSVLLLLPPYLPSTAAEIGGLPWAWDDREDKALSFVTDLGLWLEHNELMSRGRTPENSQEVQTCSEAWHSGNVLLRQAVLWAMPALGELLLESLVTLPCAPPSPFAHLAHAHPPLCCSSTRGFLSQHSTAVRPLLSSKQSAHSASAPSPSTEWRGPEESPPSPQGPPSMHPIRRSSESAGSSKKERRDGLLHLALLSPQPINMMMYLLFWGRRWGDLGYIGNKSKGSPVGRVKGGSNGASPCLLPPCGFVWRFDEPNSDGLTPFDILASQPSAPQMLRIMLDEPAEGFSLLKDAARLSQLRSPSNDECPTCVMSTLASAARARAAGSKHLSGQADTAAKDSRPLSPPPQDETLFVGADDSEDDEGPSSSEETDVLPSLPQDRRKSLSHSGVLGSRFLPNFGPLSDTQDQNQGLPRPLAPATQLTSTQVLETFTRAGMVAGSDAVSAAATAAVAAHQLEGQVMRRSAAGCLQV